MVVSQPLAPEAGVRDLSWQIDVLERPNEDYPEWVYFSFDFNTEMFYELQEEANRILFTIPPRVPIGGYWTLKIGDLYLIIGPYVSEKPDTQTQSPGIC
ncbi:hypothetical protein ElyMa_000061900 [Elysia marginata]|uniref:Uncharacterized protein n=1 Tax=Elysia marginata TaxID=1093978 RepID=A0AAV4EF65_9GAST|nr:hypothetical protein ElyMa_000061900 [Elysia marginata]